MTARRPPYSSAFARDITCFLDFKAGMGLEGLTRNYILYDFDRWCAVSGAGSFDAATVESWVEQRRERLSGSHGSWMSVIRDFGRYLRANGRPDAYVLSGAYRLEGSSPTPYLLSQREADAFFDAIPGVNFHGPMRWQARCIFGLMYSCGLRPGEVRRLRPGDVRFAQREIDVVESKGNRSRRLPVTGEVVDMIARSDAATAAAMGADRQFLFMSMSAKQVQPATVSSAFRRIWRAAGLPADQHGRKPTCYLFRHHFAYANIERWAAEGRDVQGMLPYLSRYMGHSRLDRTLYYVHTSPDFLAGYAHAVSSLDDLLPEVGFDG